MPEDPTITVVAWVSRHPPLPAQTAYLERRLGPIEVRQLSKTFTDYRNVLAEVKKIGARYAVVVLPLSMIALLVPSKDITWLWAEMAPVHQNSCPGPDVCADFKPETDVVMASPSFNRHLRFNCFKRIKEVRMVTEDW